MTAEELLLPHLDAAYNLARWLLPRGHDAEDAAQEACLRALTFFADYRGGNARAWVLAIVRNTCHSWRRRQARATSDASFDEALHTDVADAATPEMLAIARDDRDRIRRAIDALPEPLREVIVLREIEGLAYRDIATVIDAPIGTVMSRLSRGRDRLEAALRASEVSHDV